MTPKPEAPIRSAVFEIRFPGHPSIEARRGDFYEACRDEFPQVFVPDTRTATEPYAIMPYRFASADGLRSLLVSLNTFAYLTTSYRSFAEFKGEFLRWFSEIRKLVPFEQLNRTGLRYQNHLPVDVTRLQDVLSRDLLPVLHRVGDLEIEPKTITQASEFQIGSGVIRILIDTQNVEAGYTLLDFDYIVRGKALIQNLESVMDNSHRVTKSIFTSSLTHQYLEELRRGGVNV